MNNNKYENTNSRVPFKNEAENNLTGDENQNMQQGNEAQNNINKEGGSEEHKKVFKLYLSLRNLLNVKIGHCVKMISVNIIIQLKQ